MVRLVCRVSRRCGYKESQGEEECESKVLSVTDDCLNALSRLYLAAVDLKRRSKGSQRIPGSKVVLHLSLSEIDQ